MKRICAALLLVGLMAGTAWAKESALDKLTAQNIAAKLTEATGTYKNWKVASPRTDATPTSVSSVYQLSVTALAVATIDKRSDKLESVVFLVAPSPQLEGDAQSKAFIMDIAQAVDTGTRLVLPNFEAVDGLKDALYKSVGPLNKKLYDDIGKTHKVRLDGINVSLTAMINDKGLYVLSVNAE